ALARRSHSCATLNGSQTAWNLRHLRQAVALDSHIARTLAQGAALASQPRMGKTLPRFRFSPAFRTSSGPAESDGVSGAVGGAIKILTLKSLRSGTTSTHDVGRAAPVSSERVVTHENWPESRVARGTMEPCVSGSSLGEEDAAVRQGRRPSSSP